MYAAALTGTLKKKKNKYSRRGQKSASHTHSTLIVIHKWLNIERRPSKAAFLLHMNPNTRWVT